MDAKLEANRDDTSPKCANCVHWAGTSDAIGPCGLHQMVTLDLAVCSQWEEQ